jgi:hypothetical protein
MNPKLLEIFHNQEIMMNLRNEVIQNFRPFHIRGFQIIQNHRFQFLKDSTPISILIQVPFHPKNDLTHQLPKEMMFACFKETLLEGVWIQIKGEVVSQL